MVNKLPLRENDKVKMALWGIDFHGKDWLYQWKFLSICLKNVSIEFQKVMDQVLVGFIFAKCYIDDINIFNSTSKDHKHYLQEVFGRLNHHNLKLHLGKCQFFYECRIVIIVFFLGRLCKFCCTICLFRKIAIQKQNEESIIKDIIKCLRDFRSDHFGKPIVMYANYVMG